MSEVRPRISGTEYECPISERVKGEREFRQFRNRDAMLGRYLLHGLVRISSGDYGMLSNGGRYYKDCGDRLEYATPEDISFENTVANEIAGERIVMDGMASYMHNEENVEAMIFSKRANSTDGNSWGYHVNLSRDMTAIPHMNDQYVHLLTAHLLSSPAMLGAGTMYRDHTGDGSAHFSLWQKIMTIRADYSSYTTGDLKPLINQREQHLSDDCNLGRMHITSVDPHISPWSSWMTMGTLSLVTRAIEQGRGNELRIGASIHEVNPLVTLSRMVATDLTFSKLIPMDDGQQMTAFDIQEKIIEIVSKTEHTDEEARILDEWKKAVADLRRDPMLLNDRSDGIAKLALIRAFKERSRERRGEDVNYSTLMAIDNKSSLLLDIDKNKPNQWGTAEEVHSKSYAKKARDTVWQQWMNEEKIEKAIFTPPENTRANDRGIAIGSGSVRAAGWLAYVYEDGRRIVTPNPYEKPENLKKQS